MRLESREVRKRRKSTAGRAAEQSERRDALRLRGFGTRSRSTRRFSWSTAPSSATSCTTKASRCVWTKGRARSQAHQTSAHPPDAVELRLLLAEEFFKRYEWAFQLFEQEDEGGRGREWRFAQRFLTPVFLPQERLKFGLEKQCRNFTDKDSRSDPSQEFVTGPTVAFKPTRNTRLDLSPLFGANLNAPSAHCRPCRKTGVLL